MISVILLATNYTPATDRTRKELATTTTPIEVILVVNKEGSESTCMKYTSEKIVITEARGRGYTCQAGLQVAKGDVVIFLHADTILPPGWNERVLEVLDDEKVVGGAFSLTFDKNHWFLHFLIFFSDLLFRVTGELWGDRAIFVRSRLLNDQPEILDVSIMEDIRLSYFMKKRGKVVLLKEKVVTSSESFFRHGLLRHTLRIIGCRLWYALGGNPEKIYNYYYSR